MTQDEKVELVARLTETEVVALRLGDTPDWVWSPPETAPHDYYVELLLDAPDGLKRVVGIYREGHFFGKNVKGWFAPETISENGRPTHGMYVDGLVKGWRPYRYHLELAALSTIPVEEPSGDAVREALQECQDKLWVIHFGLKDEAEREAAINACNMATAALAQSQPSPDKDEALEAATEALTHARDTFYRYAKLHRAKETDEGDEKACANASMGEEMDRALTAIVSVAPRG